MALSAYKRALVKISGESLAGESGTGFDFKVLSGMADVIKKCCESGVQLAIVVGAGNIWRGIKNGDGRIERVRADHMGMLGTVINALALADVLEQKGVPTAVMTAVEMHPFAEPFSRAKAIAHLERGRVVIFGCGTGNPLCSTDTAAILRAIEIDANIALLAKNIDGVYNKDPRKFPDAKKIDVVTYDDILAQHLGVIDATAASMANDMAMPALLFGAENPENIYRAILGENIGSIVRKA